MVKTRQLWYQQNLIRKQKCKEGRTGTIRFNLEDQDLYDNITYKVDKKTE